MSDRICKTCGGVVRIILKRAWCGGPCESFWQWVGGRWELRMRGPVWATTFHGAWAR